MSLELAHDKYSSTGHVSKRAQVHQESNVKFELWFGKKIKADSNGALNRGGGPGIGPLIGCCNNS